jgi:hypothetical protein
MARPCPAEMIRPGRGVLLLPCGPVAVEAFTVVVGIAPGTLNRQQEPASTATAWEPRVPHNKRRRISMRNGVFATSHRSRL